MRSDFLQGLGSIFEDERKLAEIYPSFVPLVCLGDEDVKFGGNYVGYRLSDLMEGDSSVYGVSEYDYLSEAPRRFGASLVEVLIEWAADNHRQIVEQFDSPLNYGVGSVSEEFLEAALEPLSEFKRKKESLG